MASYRAASQLAAELLRRAPADPERDPSTLAIVGAGAALAISDIPFEHVLGGVRVGSVNGKLLANPSYEETRDSQINIVVAGGETQGFWKIFGGRYGGRGPGAPVTDKGKATSPTLSVDAWR